MGAGGMYLSSMFPCVYYVFVLSAFGYIGFCGYRLCVSAFCCLMLFFELFLLFSWSLFLCLIHFGFFSYLYICLCCDMVYSEVGLWLSGNLALSSSFWLNLRELSVLVIRFVAFVELYSVLVLV
jgi:hypothetical protein